MPRSYGEWLEAEDRRLELMRLQRA
jgi:hypothetical protein